MTREEAIKHGQEQLEVFGGEHKEFIELAIKALEQLDIIRGIVSKSEYPREDVIRYKMICDVLGVEHA